MTKTKTEYRKWIYGKISTGPIHPEGHFGQFCTRCGSTGHKRSECTEVLYDEDVHE